MLEKTLESPLDCKETQPVNPKGNQSWIFIGRTMLKLKLQHFGPGAKNQLIEKDPDAGKDWRQEEQGMTEDEMVGWYHQLDGHEFEQALGVGDGQGGLVCCSPWGCKELDTTEQLNWTELTWDRGKGMNKVPEAEKWKADSGQWVHKVWWRLENLREVVGQQATARRLPGLRRLWNHGPSPWLMGALWDTGLELCLGKTDLVTMWRLGWRSGKGASPSSLLPWHFVHNRTCLYVLPTRDWALKGRPEYHPSLAACANSWYSQAQNIIQLKGRGQGVCMLGLLLLLMKITSFCSQFEEPLSTFIEGF